MTTFAEFRAEIKEIEGRLAYGSESSIYRYFVHQMTTIGGNNWCESDIDVPANELAWWRRCYELYEVDQALPLDEQAADCQEIFDRV